MERKVLNNEGFFVGGSRDDLVASANRVLLNLGLTARDLVGKTTLDVGAGIRQLEAAFVKSGLAGRVVSVDIEPEVLGYLAIKPSGAIRTDVVRFGLPFADNSFDLVINHGGPIFGDVMHSDEALLVGEALRVVKPGGEIYLAPVFKHRVPWIQYQKYLDGEEGFGQDEHFSRTLHILHHNRAVYDVELDDKGIPLPTLMDGVHFWYKIERKYSKEKLDLLYGEATDALARRLAEMGYKFDLKLWSTYNALFETDDYQLKIRKAA